MRTIVKQCQLRNSRSDCEEKWIMRLTTHPLQKSTICQRTLHELDGEPMLLSSCLVSIFRPRVCCTTDAFSFSAQFRLERGCEECEADGRQIQQKIWISICVLKWTTFWREFYKVGAFRSTVLWSFLTSSPSRVRELTDSSVEFGLIPKEHWYQPEWIDEEKASESRKKMAENNVIYGG